MKMIIHNKLDQSFGPVGTFSGILVFVAGMATLYFSLYSILLILIGAFVGFTYSSAEIDLGRKRVRLVNNLFGIIKTGTWINVKPDMKIGITRSKKTWRSYSGGNRELDIANEDYRLMLSDFSGKKLIPVSKTSDLHSAKSELEKICNQLEVSSIS